MAYHPTADEFLMVWVQGAAPNLDLYGRPVHADGSMDSEIALWTAAGHQRAAAGAAGYLVAAEHEVANGIDLYGLYVSAAGVPETPFALATGSAWQGAPAVAYGAAAAEYLVAWQEGSPLGDVRGRFVSVGNGAQPDPFAIATTGASEETPAVAYSALTAEYVVGWGAGGLEPPVGQGKPLAR